MNWAPGSRVQIGGAAVARFVLVGGPVLLAVYLDPVRASLSWTAALYVAVTTLLGASLWLLIGGVVGADWRSPLAPLLDRLARPTVGLLGLFGVFLILARLLADPASPAGGFAEDWFRWPLWAVRLGLVLALWAWVNKVVLQQRRPGRLRVAMQAGALALLIVTFWILSFDCLLLFAGGWQSTLFPFYHLLGTLLTGIAMTGMAAFSQGVFPSSLVRRSIVFLSPLWAYLWFSLYMLIWYAGIPAESAYWLRRSTAGWASLLAVLPLAGWAIPFGVFLWRRLCDRWEFAYAAMAVLLFGRWLDAYLALLPENLPNPWPLLPLDLLPMVLILVRILGGPAQHPPQKAELLRRE